MKRATKVVAVLFFLLININFVEAQEFSALEVIKKADQKNRGKTSSGEMKMTIERADWNRSISMKSWSKGTEYFMIYITSPAKEKGQVFLKRKKEMWNWVPSIEKMIKIPPSMMMQSWMGSDFTNDDLVKQSSIIVDYTHDYLGKEIVRELECHKIQLTVKPDAPVVWGKIIVWVSAEGFDIWKAEYYDEDGYLVNIENAFELKKMGDRTIPTRMEIVPVEKKNQKTILEFISLKFDEPIEDGFFSQQNMKRIR
ncbi:MAG: outer membrane lipoprotein-sorting protein [Bacteroidetes bacterium]|jgi:outer membrane lipoprotein-sorting protein|nr:outer membrane lipoprotein-sorting protein [Bacteroidota bacterium]MBT6685496.1 outer membrane lipoprotein-sorting protein [Bacteroidota bacterium]MBT7144603.1 outer membrane lipoprotein-sorting protein [Bacteroidota bacterium]MBT7493493.1 outer membrane lipoprotein-sorting protein [Bacteroidota bacterium]